jgi:hypothetical protein
MALFGRSEKYQNGIFLRLKKASKRQHLSHQKSTQMALSSLPKGAKMASFAV